MSICQLTFINQERDPRSAPAWAEGQPARGLHSCGPVRGSSRRSVTATLQSTRQRDRTLVRTKSMHENNLYKLPPGIRRGKTRIQAFVVQLNADIKKLHANAEHTSSFICGHLWPARNFAFENPATLLSQPACFPHSNSGCPTCLMSSIGYSRQSFSTH